MNKTENPESQINFKQISCPSAHSSISQTRHRSISIVSTAPPNFSDELYPKNIILSECMINIPNSEMKQEYLHAGPFWRSISGNTSIVSLAHSAMQSLCVSVCACSGIGSQCQLAEFQRCYYSINSWYFLLSKAFPIGVLRAIVALPQSHTHKHRALASTYYTIQYRNSIYVYPQSEESGDCADSSTIRFNRYVCGIITYILFLFLCLSECSIAYFASSTSIETNFSIWLGGRSTLPSHVCRIFVYTMHTEIECVPLTKRVYVPAVCVLSLCEFAIRL